MFVTEAVRGRGDDKDKEWSSISRKWVSKKLKKREKEKWKDCSINNY